MATMAVFTLLDLTKVFSINSYVYLATLGLVVTLVVAVIASLFGQPKYYGRPGWERVPTASNRKEVKLGELEKQILEMLRIGHCYMSDLTDALVRVRTPDLAPPWRTWIRAATWSVPA